MEGSVDYEGAALHTCTINNLQMGDYLHDYKGANSSITSRIKMAKWEGLQVVVKEIIIDTTEQEILTLKANFMRECKRMSCLNHPNLVCFLGVCFPCGNQVPSLVMEHLHCNLKQLLEMNEVIPLEIKMRIVHGVGLGLRYLHSQDPPIVHKYLSSTKILVSESIGVKIAHLNTARFIDHVGTNSLSSDFSPPERLSANNVGRKVDIFSFGCVIIHTLSHQWPTPSQNMVNSNDLSEAYSCSEIERRSQYLDKIPKSVEDVMVPLISNCLENVPVDRPTAEEVCDQLETLVANRQSTLPDNLLQAQLRLQEVLLQVENQTAELDKTRTKLVKKTSELQEQNSKVDSLNLEKEMARLQVNLHQELANYYLQTSKSSKKFWNTLKLTWSHCTDLPGKRWVHTIALLHDRIYLGVVDSGASYCDPLVYDVITNCWDVLPPLPYAKFSLVAVPDKHQLLAIGGFTKNYDDLVISDEVFLWDEKYAKWSTPYPNMPTGRCVSSAIAYQSEVIVAGGITCLEPQTLTRAVEVLYIDDINISNSQWRAVERLPHVVSEPVPLIIGDTLYIAVGSDNKIGASTCSVVAASLPELLQNSCNAQYSGQVWNKLPDMPYASFSVNHYHGQLVIFSGDCMVEQPDEDKPIWELLSLMHIYNPDTKAWDYVGNVPRDYYLGRSVKIGEDKFIFIGGMAGKHNVSNVDDLLTTCTVLTISE